MVHTTLHGRGDTKVACVGYRCRQNGDTLANLGEGVPCRAGVLSSILFLTTSFATKNVNESVPLMDTRSYGSLDSTAPPKSPSATRKVLMNFRVLGSGVSATSSAHKTCITI